MLKVIYEDNHIIVVEKPFGVPAQLDESKDEDLLTMVKEYIKLKYNKPGEAYIGLVHRLDRVAGGVMIFARTSKAASRLSEQIRNRTFEKEYFAVVEGKPNKDSETVVDYLCKDNNTNTVRVVDKTYKNSKEAKLYYELIETKERLSLLNIKLYTGRPHQIRVQLSSRGYLIYGDSKYNSSYKNKRAIALWSKKITIIHPTKKKKMTFELNPPNIAPWDIFTSIKE